jgi:TonB-dependent SusC/RagA subfamily outer membrane receptor
MPPFAAANAEEAGMYRRTIQIRPKIPAWGDAVLVALVSVIGTCTLAAQPPAPPACDSTVMIMVMDGHAQRLTRTHCSIRTVIDTTSLGGESARTLSAALAGRIASLGVLQSSGVLGAGSRVRLRGGYGLILPREPLLIIDGIRADGGQSSLGIDVGGQSPSRLDDIPLDDIDRIEVLPGPAAAAAYGANSAGGVILVTTRHGVAGPTQWRSHVEGGVSSDAGTYPDNVATGPPSYGDSACTRAGAATGECVPGAISRWNPLERANPFRTGVRVAGGASASGGSERVRYYVGGEGSRDGGPLAPNDQRGYSARGNVDVDPARGLHIALHGSQVVRTTTLPFGNSELGVLRDGLFGNTADDPVLRGYRDEAPATVAAIVTQQHIARATGSVTASWNPRGRLTITGLAGRELVRRDDSRTFPLAAAYVDPALSGPWNFQGSTGRDTRTTIGGTAGVGYHLAGPLEATTRVGAERLTVSLRSRDSIQYFSQDGDPGSSSRRLAHALSTRVGVYASQELSWKGRRLDASIRRDGRDERYLLAPATSWSTHLTWNAGSEAFLARRRWARGLSLRAGYGVAADSRPIVEIVESSTLVFGPPGTARPPVPDFRPEHVAELEVAANLRVGDAIDVDLTTYRQRSTDAYEPGCCIGSAGFDDGGRWHTDGAELTLRAWLIRALHTEWRAQLTASLMHNEYDRAPDGLNRRIDGPAYTLPARRPLVRGYPIGGAWGWPLTGRDQNGDGVIVPAEITQATDSVYLGAAVPSRQAALASTLSIRRLTLSGLVDYHGGYTILNETEAYRCAIRICNALYDPSASIADQTRAVANFDSGPGFLERADFARLREVAISYALAPSWAYRHGLARLSLTIAGRNLWTVTGYSGLDPEVNVGGQATFGTVEHFTQPIPRTLVVRVDVRH